MELVNLNPELGEYFGTREGILVVKSPADSSLPLRGGDVILSIGGRHPTSASHAMRILRSYEANETVSIEILRKQKRTTVTWHVPRPEDRMRPFMRQRELRPDGVSAPDRS
jgi:S1-C subfamily serine protease